MNFKRIGVLLLKETVRGPRNFMFILGIVVPVVLSLIMTLVFGTIFSGKPRLGLVDLGRSRFAILAGDIDSVRLIGYEDTDRLHRAVEEGDVDLGLVLPADFDDRLSSNEEAHLQAYLWGESQLRHRTILGTVVLGLLRDISGQEPLVQMETVLVGEETTLTWQDRMLPFIVLVAVSIGGLMVPATSLVQEKEQRTLHALAVTPTTLGEVFAAKGLLGMLIALFMGVATLFLNQALGSLPWILILTLALGAALAAALGVLLGAFLRDVSTLFAVIKSSGIFLYAPALIFIFPEIPQWVAKIFPTYYIVQPVIEIAQQGAGWREVAPELLVLLVLLAAMIVITAILAPKRVFREV